MLKVYTVKLCTRAIIPKINPERQVLEPEVAIWSAIVCASSARVVEFSGEREKAIGKSDVICRRTHHEWRKVWLRLFMNVESGAGRFLATSPYDGDAHAEPAKSAQAVRAGTTENASHLCFQLSCCCW